MKKYLLHDMAAVLPIKSNGFTNIKVPEVDNPKNLTVINSEGELFEYASRFTKKFGQCLWVLEDVGEFIYKPSGCFKFNKLTNE